MMMMMMILTRVMAVMARRAPRPVNGQRAHQGPARPPRSVHGHTPAPRAVHKARSASTSTPKSARRGPASLLRPSLGLSCLSLANGCSRNRLLEAPLGRVGASRVPLSRKFRLILSEAGARCGARCSSGALMRACHAAFG